MKNIPLKDTATFLPNDTLGSQIFGADFKRRWFWLVLSVLSLTMFVLASIRSAGVFRWLPTHSKTFSYKMDAKTTRSMRCSPNEDLNVGTLRRPTTLVAMTARRQSCLSWKRTVANNWLSYVHEFHRRNYLLSLNDYNLNELQWISLTPL